MEYSFRNSSREELTTILLGDYNLKLQKGGEKEVISYAAIMAVRITKTSAHEFRIHLYPDDHRPIVISNQTFDEQKSPEGQSRSYSLFVRVLHHHLKEKSRAVFTSGGNIRKIWQWAGISVVLSFIISISADRLGFSLINPYIQSLILALLATIMVIAFSARKFPKTYQPTNIPLQYLP